jgi:ribosome-associated translation inhibitor RaiA
VYASSDKEDLYIAIDDAVDEASRSLTSKRKKYTALARRGGAKVKAMVKGLWPWGKKI